MLIALLARLGDHPTVMRIRTAAATVEVAAQSDDAELLLGPLRPLAESTLSVAAEGQTATEPVDVGVRTAGK